MWKSLQKCWQNKKLKELVWCLIRAKGEKKEKDNSPSSSSWFCCSYLLFLPWILEVWKVTFVLLQALRWKQLTTLEMTRRCPLCTTTKRVYMHVCIYIVCLGCLYCNGQGVEQSNEIAREWWIKSAEQGVEGAIKELQDLDKAEGRTTPSFIPKPLECASCYRPHDPSENKT